jgi:hypothetical protein
MGQSVEMRNAVTAFEKIYPDGCEVEAPRPNKPLYRRVKVSEWPAFNNLHYEFKFVTGEGLFVECHIENDNNLTWLGDTFRQIAIDLKNIHGYKINYYQTHSKHKLPFLRVEYGFGVSEGDKAAQVMLELINQSRDRITRALSDKGMAPRPKTLTPQRETIEEYLPDWPYVKSAIDEILHDDPTCDEILDEIKKKAGDDKKILKKNWREITRRNIPIWIAHYAAQQE